MSVRAGNISGEQEPTCHIAHAVASLVSYTAEKITKEGGMALQKEYPSLPLMIW
jgi:hypothetical protein